MNRMEMAGISSRKHTSISGSVYIRVFNGKARTVRISDHPPHDQGCVDISIHPGSRDTLDSAFQLVGG